MREGRICGGLAIETATAFCADSALPQAACQFGSAAQAGRAPWRGGQLRANVQMIRSRGQGEGSPMGGGAPSCAARSCTKTRSISYNSKHHCSNHAAHCQAAARRDRAGGHQDPKDPAVRGNRSLNRFNTVVPIAVHRDRTRPEHPHRPGGKVRGMLPAAPASTRRLNSFFNKAEALTRYPARCPARCQLCSR
jgi:hypothetical protein